MEGLKMRRYLRNRQQDGRKNIEQVLRLLFVPPACFAVWFGIACFCTMCYLTAFGFG